MRPSREAFPALPQSSAARRSGTVVVRADEFQQLNEEINGLNDDALKLERRADRRLQVLRSVDLALQGIKEYEHLWLNYPYRPEQTPASLVRDEIHRSEREEAAPSAPNDRS